MKVVNTGAYIAECTREHFRPLPIKSLGVRLTVNDLEQVEALYSKVFSGYPKVKYMKTKLSEGRGIGYKIRTDKLVSVAQSELGMSLWVLQLILIIRKKDMP